MSCDYCENLSSYRVDRERGSGIEAENNRHTFADIAKDKETGKFYLELDDGDGACFEIDFCPKCGRDLKTRSNEFAHSVKIPVPMGAKVWTFWTTCCNACAFQPRKNQEIYCDRGAPCHTLRHAIQHKTMSFSNMEEIINGWGIYYFATAKEAEAAGEKRIAANIQKMRALGYDIDDKGYASKKEGWENVDE